MLENINYALFALINATPASPQWAIEVAILIAKDLILIVPLLVVTLWLWGPAQRQMVFKLMLALMISLTVSWASGGRLLPQRSWHRQLYLCPGFSVLAPPVVRRAADGHRRRHRLVPRLSRRALAAGYGRRSAGRNVRLPWRGADLAYVRPGAVSPAAATVSSLLLPADPQRLGTRLNASRRCGHRVTNP